MDFKTLVVAWGMAGITAHLGKEHDEKCLKKLITGFE